jgi:two-component system, LuxR family, sensor kinase FixL
MPGAWRLFGVPMRLSIRATLIAGLALVAAALAGNAAVSIRSTRALAADDARVLASTRTLSRLAELLSTLKDAETGQRGYLLTGREEYLGPYKAAAGRVAAALRDLEASAAGSSIPAGRLVELRRLVDAKLAELGSTVSLQEGKEPAAALAIVLGGSGKATMDAIRRLVAGLEDAERAELDRRAAAAAAGLRRAEVSSVVASLAALALVGITLAMALRHLAERRRSEEALRGAYERLEQLVGERTAELSAANAALQAEVAERRRAEAAQRTSEERARAVVDCVRDYAIFMLDPEGRVVSWNQGGQRIKGYRPEEIIGRHFSCFYTAEDIGRGHPTHELEIAASEGRYEEEGWRVRKDGTRFWANVVITALRDDEGELRGFAKVTRDMTERKQAEERLRDFAARLERSNRELQEFASVASHDLQEPLRKIQAFGDRLRTKCAEALGEQGRDYLERMEDAATRMRGLINDLLTFSRVTSKARPFVPVDLDRVAREVLSDLDGRIQQTGARVELSGLPTLDADPTQMRQLLQNLIGNALKFHRPGEPPAVEVRGGVLPGPGPGGGGNGAGPPLCRVVVRDHGIGFDPKYRDRIFNVFQRLHGRGEYEGTGMGLAICRKIVEHHGGAIDAEGRPGEGAAFTVTLPVAQVRGGESDD